MSNNTNDFIGKHYELLKIDGSIMVRIKINYCRREEIVSYDDTANWHNTNEIFHFSEDGFSWYQYAGGNSDRVV